MRKILIIDTSILCVYLKVPHMDSCGPTGHKWDFIKVEKKIDKEIQKHTTLVLPLASLIETGNHIAQATGDKYSVATSLAKIIKKTANAETPWAAFTFQNKLWEPERLTVLADTWPTLAKSSISIGDATIKDVAEHYSLAGYEVEILTGDAGLKAYEPVKKPVIPRRRK